MIAFTIPGPPQGKARVRTCRNGHSYTPENTVLYENLVKTEFLRQCGREQRIRAEQNRPATLAGAVRGAVSQAMRDKVEENEITTLREFLSEYQHINEEFRSLLKPLE